jgi:uncharacterized membrane protein YhaH (DUF805 family)
MNFSDVPRVSRYTFRFHLWAQILEGFFVGVFGMADVVARKGLGASETEIVILASAGPAFSVFASMWAVFMEGRAKRPFIVAAALVGRGALLLTAILSGSMWFVAICCVVYLADPVFIPAQQAIFQSNYDTAWRGRLHGWITLLTRAILVGASMGAAIVLDQDPDLYRLLFPACAVVGILAYLQFAMIRVRWRPGAAEGPVRASGVWRRVRQILRENRAFDRFERNFYLYGTAFHMLVPVNLFLLVDHLELSYSENALARTVLFQISLALLAPLAGLALDRWRAARTAGWAFVLLALFPLILIAAYAARSAAVAYLGFVWFGIAMAGVNAAWQLGAIEFSRGEDASIYMGIHVSAVGVRGLCAPIMGVALAQGFGLWAAYGVASALFLLGGLLMLRRNISCSTQDITHNG